MKYKKSFYILLGLLSLVMMADVVTTYMAYGNGGYELNTLVAGLLDSPMIMYGMKIVAVLVMITAFMVWQNIYMKDGQIVSPNPVIACLAGFMVYVNINNLLI